VRLELGPRTRLRRDNEIKKWIPLERDGRLCRFDGIRPDSLPQHVEHTRNNSTPATLAAQKGRIKANRTEYAEAPQTTPSKAYYRRQQKHGIEFYFTQFPPEILELILANTPTDEVKSLGRTSKGLNMIIPSRLGQSFWASRFQDPFEYGCVFEAQTHKAELVWKVLYFSITKAPFLRNRQRMWGLIKQLSELISVEWEGGQGLLPLTSDENEWKEVHGLIQQPERDENRSKSGIKRGCVRLYSQYTSIPALLCRIVVSTVSIGTATYITGLCFISKAPVSNQESKICLGYTSKKELSPETTGLQGFIIAVGSRGIHAIRFVTPGQLSPWFGNPKGVPITRRVVSYKPITALKARFDVRLTYFFLYYLFANKV
jgi:hypothetical protein